MMDSKIRPYCQKGFNELGRGLVKLHLKPDQITLMAFLLGLLAAFLTVKNQTSYALFALWLSGLFDVLDGTVARLMQMSTKMGAFLDLIFDRLVEISMIFAFYFIMPEHTLMYLIFLAGVIFNFSSFLLAGMFFENEGEKAFYYDPGILERTETFIFFSLVLIFKEWTFIFFFIFNFLMFLTGIIRLLSIYHWNKNNISSERRK